MPLVVIQYAARPISRQVLIRLVAALPDVVAAALDVPGLPEGRLTPEDIEVWVQESGDLNLNIKDLEIVIWANLYPERLENLTERNGIIASFVRDFLRKYGSGLNGYVWTMLQPAAFSQL